MAQNDSFNQNSVNIPIELIGDMTPKERYLFNAVAALDDKFNELGGKTDKQTDLLNKILEQTTATNGKVKELRKDTDTLITENLNNKPEIETIKTVKKVIRTKYFWTIVGAIFLVGLPWVYTNFPPQVIVAKVISLMNGS